ncbi:MAG: hypothetical protein M3Q65_05645, partial [Chloroflexota bacterium]|nr:hypothetical protein [Chloroflexota bacterium]
MLTLAQEEAQRLGHSYIGPEHILLGLVREGDGIAARVLDNLGVQLPKVRAAVEFRIGRGESRAMGEIGLTAQAKTVIERAVEEARRLDHHYIGTEHLLLGLVRDGESIAAQALESLGVSPEKARAQVIQVISNQGGYSQSDLGRQGRGENQPPSGTSPSLAEALRGLEAIRNELAAAITAQDFDLANGLRQRERQLKERISRLEREGQQGAATLGGGDRFDRFTERARRVLTLAREEAQRFGHNYIGTEHLLLGLVREGDGVAARVLGNLGVELPRVRTAVEFIIGRGESLIMGEIGLTPRAKKVIELAVDEARRLNHHYVGTEHLLLGLIREGEGIAAGVLESMGVSLGKVRAQVMQVVGGGASLPGSPAEPGAGVAPLVARGSRQPFGTVHVPVDPLGGLVVTALSALAQLAAERRVRPASTLAAGLGAAALLPAIRDALGGRLVRSGRVWRGRVVDRAPRLAGIPRPVAAYPPGPPYPPRLKEAYVSGSVVGREGPPPGPPPQLGELMRVIPIAQTREHDGTTVSFLSLEVYADGFLLHSRIRFGQEQQQRRFGSGGPFEMTLDVRDDRGGEYRVWPGGGGGNPREWRFEHRCGQALDPAARELRVTVTELRWRRLDREQRR